jgi:hypothetical protein
MPSLNRLLPLSDCAFTRLAIHQRATRYRQTGGRGLAMSGIAIFGLVSVSAWLTLNIAIAVVAVLVGSR